MKLRVKLLNLTQISKRLEKLLILALIFSYPLKWFILFQKILTLQISELSHSLEDMPSCSSKGCGSHWYTSIEVLRYTQEPRITNDKKVILVKPKSNATKCLILFWF